MTEKPVHTDQGGFGKPIMTEQGRVFWEEVLRFMDSSSFESFPVFSFASTPFRQHAKAPFPLYWGDPNDWYPEDGTDGTEDAFTLAKAESADDTHL